MDDGQRVSNPTLEELASINQARHLRCTTEELKSLQEIINSSVEGYNFVNDYKCPPIISKYGGKRNFNFPTTEENVHNAWYVKCDIKGSNQGKLVNKTVAIKDNTAVAHIPMMNGSGILEGYIPEYDATIVQRILEQGGNIVGKSTCEDLCLSGASFFNKYGPVLNPFNKEFSAGGSSSGSAVLVALGEVDMAIGGDQGGSVRIPASNCGIVGLKPTHGLVPYTGACPILPSIDHLGPMAKNVADCALLLECIAGYDNGFDYRQMPYEVPDYSKLIYPNVKPTNKIKVGILKEAVNFCDDNVNKVFSKAIRCLKLNEMLEISEVSYPTHSHAPKIFGPIMNSGIFASMIQGCGYGASIKGIQSHTLADKLQTGFIEHSGQASPNIKMMTMFGDYIQQKHGSYHYAKASTIIAHMTLEYNKLLNEYDVVIMPTLTKTPSKLPTSGMKISERVGLTLNMLQNTAIFNATGHPALSLNCGFDGELPVGLQIVGKHFDEVTVLNAASVFEESLTQLTKL